MTARVLLLLVALSAPTLAADPVVVTLPEKATAPGGVVTLGHVAKLSGGTESTRQKMAALDIEDRGGVTVTKKQIAIRLKLAGIADDEFVLAGSDRVAVGGNGGTLTAEKAVVVAKAELAKRLGKPESELFIDLVQAVLAKMPETTAADDVEIEAVPNVGTVRLGRTQMNVTVRVNGKQRLTFAVHLNAAAVAATDAAKKPAAESADAVLIRNTQQVKMYVRLGDAVVGATGEAMQDGKLGQQIKVKNVDSKKVVVGTVSGPGAVDVDPGGR